MSFVAAPPSNRVRTPHVSNVVEGDGWYPDVSISDFRDSMRLGTVITDVRARDAIIGGMLSADNALAPWRLLHEAIGITSLELVPSLLGKPIVINGEGRTLHLWRRAVYAFAAADLAETHSDISATEAGRDRRETRAASADEHRRNATIAIRDLLGRGRAKVALI